jgi:hypothetical protein
MTIKINPLGQAFHPDAFACTGQTGSATASKHRAQRLWGIESVEGHLKR